MESARGTGEKTIEEVLLEMRSRNMQPRMPKSRIDKGGILLEEVPDILIGPGPYAPLPSSFIGPGRNLVLDWQPSESYRRYLEFTYGSGRSSK